MSVAAKTRLMTNIEVIIDGIPTRPVQVPKKAVGKILSLVKSSAVKMDKEDWVPVEKVFSDWKDPVKRGASVLRGFRTRDNLTQVELAKKIKVAQTDISAMERGGRAIGKVVAQRLAKVFKCDYRVFL